MEATTESKAILGFIFEEPFYPPSNSRVTRFLSIFAGMWGCCYFYSSHSDGCAVTSRDGCERRRGTGVSDVSRDGCERCRGTGVSGVTVVLASLMTGISPGLICNPWTFGEMSLPVHAHFLMGLFYCYETSLHIPDFSLLSDTWLANIFCLSVA